MLGRWSGSGAGYIEHTFYVVGVLGSILISPLPVAFSVSPVEATGHNITSRCLGQIAPKEPCTSNYPVSLTRSSVPQVSIFNIFTPRSRRWKPPATIPILIGSSSESNKSNRNEVLYGV